MIELNNDSLEAGGSSTDNSSTGSNSKGSGGRRSMITVSNKYGTTCFGTNTSCEVCNSRAVGVFILPDEHKPDDNIRRAYPMCSSHRDDTREDYDSLWEVAEFRRFVDA